MPHYGYSLATTFVAKAKAECSLAEGMAWLAQQYNLQSIFVI